MQRTRAARRETEWLLDDSTLQEIRTALPDHPAIVAAFDEAKRIRDAATGKLAQAYHQVLDNADTLDTPIRPDDRHGPVQFMNDAESTFKDTPYQEGLVSRARALHERFEAEYAAIIQARQELWDKLMVDGDAAWSSIVESTGATELDPNDEVSRGKTVLLRGVYNRAGWEWGRMTERTTIVRRDQYGAELGTEEQWLPVDGVVLDITGLHAGPVAVGPAHDWQP